MEPSTRSPSKPEQFSPILAIALSWPLLILLSWFVGPVFWDRVIAFLGVKAPNLAGSIRGSLSHLVIGPSTIGLFIFCPMAASYCSRTQGYKWLRRILGGIHLILSTALYLSLLYALVWILVSGLGR